ncbi:MAG: anhydro-N-acetylmuramic acid kinase [Armatimonadota bacterium]|nr:anhydro-N-acetylmuramic acid kinase [Armatimonadota bacterium]MDW8105005.1 anhydro-N-acetylmuramic acid kinase [Armatimonadota bacterium]
MSTKSHSLVIGLISGTSMDGIDAALVRLHEVGESLQVETLDFHTTPYPTDVRAELLRTVRGETGVAELCHLNFLLGELFAEAALQIMQRAGVTSEQLLCIASHGQTVWHQPEPVEWQGRAIRSTLQIGEPAVIAVRTGVPVVADFRVTDVAAGGQGAPLVPYVDYLLFRHPAEGRILLNIGGIANLTAIPAGATPEMVIAFDTGPGNALVNIAMEIASGGKYRYDPEGSFAQRHPVREEWLNELLQHPYFQQPPPKSTGRETFGEAMVRRLMRRYKVANAELLVPTLTELTVRTVAEGIQRYVLPRMEATRLIVSGGGVHNRTMMQRLQQLLPSLQVESSDRYGIHPDAKEAVAFAILGYQRLQGRTNNLPSATGAQRAVVMGKVCLP